MSTKAVIKTITFGDWFRPESSHRVVRGKPLTRVIPTFQRGYAWEKDDVIEFMEDLFIAFNNTDGYNVFELSIATSYFEKDLNQEWIVDGQQRLTTLTLILCSMYYAIINREVDKNDETVRDYIIRTIIGILWETDKKRPYMRGPARFQHQYTEIDKSQLSFQEIYQKGKSHYNTNVSVAYDIIDKMIQEEFETKHKSNQSFTMFLSDLLDYLLDNVEFYLETRNSLTDSLHVFRSRNSKGKEFTPIELIKLSVYDLLEGEEKDVFSGKWNQFKDRIDSLKNSCSWLSMESVALTVYFIRELTQKKTICQLSKVKNIS